MDSMKNRRISTIELIKSMQIGDYFLLDKSWIKITENHVLMVKEIL